MNQRDFFTGYARGTLKHNARLGNVYIDGAVIYSYGSHFPMAKKDGERAWVNVDKYSKSTSKQQSFLRSALLNAGYSMMAVTTKELKEMI